MAIDQNRGGASSLCPAAPTRAADRAQATGPGAVDLDERRANWLVPGRTTLINQERESPAVFAIDAALRAGRAGVTMLSRAIATLDFFEAWSAGRRLRNRLARLDEIATHGDVSAQNGRELSELRAAAEPLLTLAPVPSEAAIREVVSGLGRERWAVEEATWRSAHGGLARARSGGRPDAPGPARIAPAEPVAAGGLALTHEQFEAAADNRVAQMARAGRNLNAAAYLHHNFREVREAVRAHLSLRPIPLAHSQVRFLEDLGYSGFVAALLAPLAGDDDSAHVRALRAWLAPVGLDALVDRNRPIFEAASPRDTAEYTRGPKGPAGWCESVGIAIGSAIEVGLSDSLPRMAIRLVAKVAEKRARTEQASDQLRVPGELVPSTPLDWQVARAMIGAIPTVDVVAGALKVGAGARLPYRKLARIEWQGDKGGPWNAIRVEPADAGPEEVAAELLHSPAEAYRLRRLGAYYLLPDEAALAIPGARTARLAQQLTGTPGMPSGEEQLALAPSARRLVDEEARHSFDVRSGPGADPAALLRAWERIDEQLHGLASEVEPSGFEHELDGALAFHASRRAELAQMYGRDATTRGAALELQRALLAQVGAELAPLVGPDAPGAGEPTDPRRHAIARLVRVVNLAHLPETGRAALHEAHAAQDESLYDTLEAILGQAATFIALAGAAPASRANASRAVFEGAGLRQRAEQLRGELAAQRMRAMRGNVTAEQLRDLHRQIEALRTDAQLVAEIGALAATFDLLDRLEDSGWVLFSEAVSSWSSDDAPDNHIGRLETARRGAAELRGELETAHGRWIKAQARAVALANDLAAAGVKDAGARAREAMDVEIATIMVPLQVCGGHAEVQAFLRRAHQMSASAERRALIAQIAVTVGAAVVADGVGAFAEGLIAGTRVVAVTAETAAAEGAAMAARAAGSRTLAAQLVGTAANTVTFTALQATLSNSPLLGAFASNFVGNFAGFGALRATRKALVGVTAGKAGIALWVTRTANLTAPLLVSTAVQFVQQELETALRAGRTMSWDELHAAGVQTLAMMIGSAIAHHVLRGSLQATHDAGHELTASRAQRKQLEVLATEVTATGNPTKALELLWATRTYLAAIGSQGSVGARATQALGELGKLERSVVPAQLGLDVVMVGRVYIGDHDAVARVVEIYRRSGYHVDPAWDGFKILESPAAWSPVLTIIDRSALARGAHTRPESTRAPSATPEAAPRGRAAAPSPAARVDQPVSGLFHAVDPRAKVADWDIFDVAYTNQKGIHNIKTKVTLPDGGVGLLYQSYDPLTKALALRSVYVDQLPRWITEGPHLVDGKGIPTVTYLLHRQWKMLGVEYGELATIYLKNVEEIRSVIELAVLVADGLPDDVAVLRTHTTEYATTALVQGGHRITSAKVSGGRTLPLDTVLQRFESSNGTLTTRAERARRDPTIAARNDQLILDYGKRRISRTTPVRVDFDIEFKLAPFGGTASTNEP